MIFKKQIIFIYLFFVIGLSVNILHAQDPYWKLIDKGIFEYQHDNSQSAIEYLTIALKDPDITTSSSILANFYLAASYFDLEQKEIEYSYLKKILLTNPDQPLHEKLSILRKDWDYVMQQLFCNITINSNPQNASVHIDGNDKGETPTTIYRLFKDSLYNIEIIQSGYNPWTNSQKFNRDETLNITLVATAPPTIQPRPKSEPGISINFRPAPALPYIFGVGSSAGLWFIFQQISIQFYNTKRENIQSLTTARTETAYNQAEKSIRKNDFWGQFFYWGSYVSIASGIFVGKYTQNKINEYELYGNNDIKIYYAFNDKFTPSINIRRNIW
jgi:hypothetical protein